MAEASYRFALVGEDEGHFRVVSALVDAISRETITWLVDQNLDDFREWRADSSPAAPNFTRVSDVKRVGNVVYIDGKPLRLRGFIAGQSLGVESSLWRVALGNLMKQKPSPHLVVFARDLDGKRERGVLRIETGWPSAAATIAARSF